MVSMARADFYFQLLGTSLSHTNFPTKTTGKKMDKIYFKNLFEGIEGV